MTRARSYGDGMDDAEPDTVDEDLWGSTPTEAQLGAAVKSGQRESEARLAQVRAVSVTVEEAARSTGVTGDAVALGGPALAGAADLAMAFPGGTVALTLRVRKPCADLDGRTPAQAPADGHFEAVIATARALTAAGW